MLPNLSSAAVVIGALRVNDNCLNDIEIAVIYIKISVNLIGAMKCHLMLTPVR